VGRGRAPDLVKDGLPDQRGGVSSGIGAERGQQARDHAAVFADCTFRYPTVLAQPLLEQHHMDVDGRWCRRRQTLDGPAFRQEPDEAAGAKGISPRHVSAASDAGASTTVLAKAEQVSRSIRATATPDRWSQTEK
jgi:hypothetical protein